MPTFAVAAVPLWLAPLVLFGAALVLVILGGRVERPARAGVGALLGALAVLAPGGGAAWSGQTLLTPFVRLARVGSLDLALGFALDRTSMVTAAALLAAWAIALATYRGSAPAPSIARSLCAAGFATAGVLADGFPLLLLGFAGAAFVTPVAVRRGSATPGRFFGFAGASVTAMALGAALLFWSLGGRWLDDARYLSDYRARFVVANEEKPTPGASRSSSPNAQGSLTIVSHPGAKIYDGVADEAQLVRSQPIAVSPAVRVPVVAGLHKIAIAPGEAAVVAGDGLEVALVDVVNIREGNETVIVLQGPSLTFHEIAPQLADTADFMKRRLLGLPAAGAVSASFLAALLLLSAALRAPLAGRLGTLAAGGALAVASVAVARVAPAVFSTPPVGLALAFVAAIVAAVWVIRAHRKNDALSPLGPLGLLATAAGSVAPLAPAAAAPAILLAAFAAEPDRDALEPAPSKPGKKTKNRVDGAQPAGRSPGKVRRSEAQSQRKAAEAKAPPQPPERVPIGSPLGLARAALSGAPIPGGVAPLGALGVAGAFAGMGLGNAAAALCVLLTWGAVVFVVWRPAGAASAVTLWAPVAALALAPLAAIALRPWAVPATESREVRAGLAVVACVIVAAVALRARTLSVRPSSDAAPATRLSWLASVGSLTDRVLGAPLDLLALPFSRSEPRTDEREGAS